MGFHSTKMEADLSKEQQGKREADSMRMLAFFGVCLSTVATMICVVSVPVAYEHFQQVGTKMQGEVDFCKARATNILREVRSNAMRWA